MWRRHLLYGRGSRTPRGEDEVTGVSNGRDGRLIPRSTGEVKQHHPNLTQHVYPAGHGFHCDERASYHKPSAEQAMDRSLQFLRQHVG